jgi:hypothetical protein
MDLHTASQTAGSKAVGCKVFRHSPHKRAFGDLITYLGR